MPELTPATAGQRLATAREKLELSLREVADALNLPIPTIEAIELDDLENLPAQVFTRGYVRAYAKYLALDADAVVAAMTYEAQPLTEDIAPRQAALGAGLKLNLHLSLKQKAVLGAVAAILVVAIIWYFASGDAADTVESAPSMDAAEQLLDAQENETRENEARESETRESETRESETRASETSENAIIPGEIPTSELEPTDEDATLAVADQAVPAAAAMEVAVADIAEPVPVVTSPGDSAVRRLTDTGNELLVLQFSDQCWVEIKDAQGEVLYENLGRAGLNLRFTGQGPFQILLGYAPGATLVYNSEPVALFPHTRNNVARLVLGQ